MKTTKMLTSLVLALALMVCLAKVSEAAPMGTAFTYQGRLIDANEAADGLYDFEFKLFDDPCTGTQQGGPIDVNDLDVIDGYFTVELDFGSDVFNGDARWLETTVSHADGSDPCTLRPRIEITPVPYALQTRGIFVDNAGNVGIGTNSPAAKLTVNGGILRSGSTMYGASAETHINLGIYSKTGTFGQDYPYATVGGGYNNTASNNGATVGGGRQNTASDMRATVGGGYKNTASNNGATVGGGKNNTASNGAATVGGGEFNTASGWSGTVGGGGDNTASGTHSTVSGGRLNEAGGRYSFAAGYRAKVRDAAASGDSDGDEGTFVWADSKSADFASTGPDQFLIRASGGVGIGTTSPTTKLDVVGTVNATAFVGDGSGLTGIAGDSDWTESGGNVYRVSGNVGIGTTDPMEKLHVWGNSAFNARSNTPGDAGLWLSSGIYSYGGLRIDNSYNLHMDTRGSTGWESRVTIDRMTGNVGIGTTSPAAKLEVAGQVKITGGSPGADKVLTSDASGLASWQTPAGGGDNLGNHIATQNIRLNGHWLSGDGGNEGVFVDNVGNVGIGTSPNPAYKLHVQTTGNRAIYAASTATSGTAYGVFGRTASSGGSAVWGEAHSATGANGVYGQNSNSGGRGVYGYATASSGTNYGVYGKTNSSTGYGGYFEGRGYFSGNVGIGTASPGAKLEVADTPLGTNDPVAIRLTNLRSTTNLFWELRAYDSGAGGPYGRFSIFGGTLGGADRLVITTLGNVGIGTTSPAEKLHVADSQASGHVAKFENTNSGTNADGIVIEIGPSSNPGSANYFVRFRDGDGTQVGGVRGNGVGGVSYTTSSDARLKTKIDDFAGGLDMVSRMKVRKYEFIEAPGNERIGFLAQEMQTVLPQVVSGDPEGDVAEEPMGIDYGRMTPVLVSSIQELIAENETLKQRLERLERTIQQLTQGKEFEL